MSELDVYDDFQHYKYYDGESENLFCGKDENPHNVLNPKALLCDYENVYHFSQDSRHKDLKTYLKYLIDYKVSEYHRNTDEL